MKKFLWVLTLFAASGMAADLSGYIMDKGCATKNAQAMMGDEACAKRCIGRGDAAVLVTEDGKVYAVANQDKVKDFAGKKVNVTGKLKDDTVTVDTIAVPKT